MVIYLTIGECGMEINLIILVLKDSIKPIMLKIVHLINVLKVTLQKYIFTKVNDFNPIIL